MKLKIALLHLNSRSKHCVNKDFMGGYGWAFNTGNSFRAKMINFVKMVGERLPIMSFGYLAAIFSQKGCEVEYVEDITPSAEVVIMQSSMVDHAYEMSWVRKLKQDGKTVGFIGPFSSALPEMFLKECDFVIKGEPEGAAYQISEGLKPEGVLETKAITNLDSLPFPKWELFPYREYSYFPALKERPFLPILSSRGCSSLCNYCPYLVNYQWRQRSANNVLDEVGYLINKFRLRALLFRDPVFTLDNKMVMDISEGILKRGYRIKWACETRLDYLNKELLKIMFLSGLRVVNVGVESSSEEIIKKASRKPIKIEHQEEIVRYCDELGVRVTAFYMLGMPDDTKESIRDTIAYAKRLNTHCAQFFIFTPFPGTQYYTIIKDSIYEKDWGMFDCYTPVFKHKNINREEMLRMKEDAFVSYYYRPSWAIKFASRAIKDMVN